MLRAEFDKLDLEDQVEYINNLKNMGMSMSSACRSIDIPPSTFGSRLGGKYKLEDNLYVPMIEIIHEDNTKVIPKKHKSNTTVINNEEDIHFESNTEVTPQVISDNNTKVVPFDNVNVNELLLSFKDMNEKLNEVYNWYELQSNTKVVSNEKLEIGDFEGNIVTRSYKLYDSIQQEFAAFCKENNKFKVQDVLSQALREFMDKYK